jgi:hypothetical protein
MLIDNEKEFSKLELDLLKFFHEEMHLSILLVTEWNNNYIQSKIQLQNTKTGNFANPLTW